MDPDHLFYTRTTLRKLGGTTNFNTVLLCNYNLLTICYWAFAPWFFIIFPLLHCIDNCTIFPKSWLILTDKSLILFFNKTLKYEINIDQQHYLKIWDKSKVYSICFTLVFYICFTYTNQLYRKMNNQSIINYSLLKFFHRLVLKSRQALKLLIKLLTRFPIP